MRAVAEHAAGRLRLRLTVVAALILAVILLLASVVIVLLFQQAVQTSADDLSRSRAQDLVTAFEAGGLPALLTDVGDNSVAQVVSQDGRVLAASANLRDSGAMTDLTPDGDSFQSFDLSGVPDDSETEDYRVWALTAHGPDGAAVVYVGHSGEAVSESSASLVRSLAFGLPLVLLTATVLLWVLIGRTLRPVEEAYRRQRAFVADAAHELQSPLAAYRTCLEVALARPADTDWPLTARSLLADGDRMERLVRDLLFLARQDGAPTDHRLVDLDDVVLEEARRLRASARVEIDTSGVSAAPVLGSRGDLGRLVRNLLANAAQHATSQVSVTLTSDATGVRLVVVDDGPGVPREHRDHVFARFYRGEESRAHESGSTGLGLAIVRAVTLRHGGTVHLEDGHRGGRPLEEGPVEEGSPGATFVVQLPAP